MKESNVKKIGVAIVFISILLVYTNLVVETFNEKTEILDKDKSEIVIDPYENNVEIEKEYNNVREGILTEELDFLIQKDTYSKFSEELSKDKIVLLNNLKFPQLYKRQKGFNENINNRSLYINNAYESNNKFIQSLIFMNLNSSDFELINNFSNDALIYKSRISLNRVNEVKNSLLGPDVVFEPSTFNFMNENQNILYNYDNNSMYYLVGEREFQLKNNSIFGVYEEIYDVKEDNDFIYVYSNLVSYNAIYSFDLKNEDYSKSIKLQIYHGVFQEYYDSTNQDFEIFIKRALNFKNNKFMYAFKKASDGNYYFHSSMNVE
jgi:hypothetical protein